MVPSRKAQIMKHCTGKTLGGATCALVFAAGLALLAGKDDIRRFYRMHSM